MSYKAVLFDMDGTLLDTLEDLRDSTNHVLRQMGYPERSLEEMRRFVGNGAEKQDPPRRAGGDEARKRSWRC